MLFDYRSKQDFPDAEQPFMPVNFNLEDAHNLHNQIIALLDEHPALGDLDTLTFMFYLGIKPGWNTADNNGRRISEIIKELLEALLGLRAFTELGAMLDAEPSPEAALIVGTVVLDHNFLLGALYAYLRTRLI